MNFISQIIPCITPLWLIYCMCFRSILGKINLVITWQNSVTILAKKSIQFAEYVIYNFGSVCLAIVPMLTFRTWNCHRLDNQYGSLDLVTLWQPSMGYLRPNKLAIRNKVGQSRPFDDDEMGTLRILMQNPPYQLWRFAFVILSYLILSYLIIRDCDTVL